jgi:hypothetical protein
MKYRDIAVILSVVLLASAAVFAQPCTFKSSPMKAGEKIDETSVLELNMVMHVDAQGKNVDVNIDNNDKYSRSMTVMEMFGNDISRFKIAYSEWSSSSKNPEGETINPGPELNRSYIVYRTDSVMSIDAEDEKPVSQEVRDVLMKELTKSDFSERMNKILDGRTMNIGDSLMIDKELAFTFLGKKGNEVKSFVIKLTAVKNVAGVSCGVFNSDISLASESGQLQMEFGLRGEFVVGINNCRPYEMVLEGPVSAAGQPQGITIVGEGTMKGTKTMRYN